MRQPVKGKPHIMPVRGDFVMRSQGRKAHLLAFMYDEQARAWGRRVCPGWTRWWRQHQEAA